MRALILRSFCSCSCVIFIIIMVQSNRILIRNSVNNDQSTAHIFNLLELRVYTEYKCRSSFDLIIGFENGENQASENRPKTD